MSGVHLADFNVARLRAPIDDPLIDEFRDNLEAINGLADRSPGFVWRLQATRETPPTSTPTATA